MNKLPDTLQSAIEITASEWFSSFIPHRRGCTDNAFFQLNEIIYINPTMETRKLSISLPSELEVIYERYPSDTEFKHDEYSFLCENEIVERYNDTLNVYGKTVIDFAFTYLGMGHIKIWSYCPKKQMIYSGIDGGANDWDRRENHVNRVNDTNAEMVYFSTIFH
jgi:hypothetical protein